MTDIADPSEDKRPFWAKCRRCGHCWPVCYSPILLTTMAELAKRAACPKCGDTDPVVADQDDGILLEPPAPAASGGDVS